MIWSDGREDEEAVQDPEDSDGDAQRQRLFGWGLRD